MSIASKPTAIIHGKIILSDQILEGKTLLIADGKIKAIDQIDSINKNEYDCVDARQKFITPGLIDLHIHGCLHHTFNEADESAFQTILSKTLSCGVTTLQPTPVPRRYSAPCRSLDFIATWKKHRQSECPKLRCLSESPYISLVLMEPFLPRHCE